MNALYPNATVKDSMEVGLQFQDWVCSLLSKEHIILQNLQSKKSQIEIGENLQGWEIKLDNRCYGGINPTGRLSIEVAEKSKATNPFWIDSGIMRKDNTWLYIQGNYYKIWIFAKKFLVNYFERQKPNIMEFNGTIKRFYLPIDLAEKHCAKSIEVKN